MENNKTSKVKISAFTISLDGFGTGLNQSKENPMGEKGSELHPWMRPTKMFQKMMGKNVGTEGVDNDFAEKSMENIGAWIMGRNMFTPSRGPWPDDGWKGWWGEEPPYHGSVYILTHHAREPIEMEGGTTFYFITGGIEEALAEAKKAANGKDIRILGGVSTVRQYLHAGYVDEMHFVISPVFLGSGEHLFQGIDIPKLGFDQIQRVEGEKATHIILTKSNK
ncbi:MAG: dihydrofolate reductase family protein [Candidatus Woesearchaeota archaeon]